MSHEASLFTRLGRWLTGRRGDELPVRHETGALLAPGDAQPVTVRRRFSFFRPFAKRDAAIGALQQGVGALAGLMDSVRENLEKQGRRQDEMLMYLSSLPRILESLPETQRAQGDAILKISKQLEQQVEQHGRLTEVLGRLATSHSDHQRFLEMLHERVAEVGQNNERIADHMRQVGASLENVGKTAEGSAQVLQQMRQSMAERDEGLEKVIRRQNARFTALLVVAIVLSVAAIGAAAFVGWQMLRAQRATTRPAVQMRNSASFHLPHA
jgi:methyl-accepting chemotaxis protein